MRSGQRRKPHPSLLKGARDARMFQWSMIFVAEGWLGDDPHDPCSHATHGLRAVNQCKVERSAVDK
jgi:hypothetical protein